MSAPTEHAGTGIPGLDEVLGGGYPRDQVHLIQGASGTGKTTLGLQFVLEGGRVGERSMYIATAETEAEIRQIARSHRWSLENVLVHPLPDLATSDPYVAQTMLHSAEVELPATMESLLAAADEVSPTRLVIDSLAEIRLLAREESWYRRQLMLLKQHFAERRCTVLVIEIPVPDQPVVEAIVSGVIDLDQLALSYGPDRRRLRIRKLRGRDFSTGYHDFRIRTGGMEVYPRLIAAEHYQRFEQSVISSGLFQLDELLGGGLDRGSSTLFIGMTGTGKSLLGTQFAVAAAERGERSAIFVFDERLQTLFQRAAGVGIPLVDHVESGAIHVRQIDPAELTPGEFSHLVRAAVHEDDVRLVVIDSLNGYAYAMPEERFLTVHLHELSSYLNQQGVTSIFVAARHGVAYIDERTPVDVSYIADIVLIFRHFEFGGEMHKAVAVHKRRSGSHERSIRELHIGSDGLTLGPPLRQFRGILTGTPDYYGELLHGDSRNE
jgi:circadian clock protein KaiC